jgi:carboxyl-terminal processing protease
MPVKMKYLSISLISAICLIFLSLSGCSFVLEMDPGNEKPEETSVTDAELALEVIEETWDIIFNEYVDKDKLDAEKLKQAAIEGMLQELNDPYSSYIDIEAYQDSMEGIEGKFEGIGAYVGMKDDKVTVVAPILNSPAEKAGIRPGDTIMGVDGESTEGMDLQEVINRIRGPKGTEVTVSVLHLGETEPVEIKITRSEIELASLYYSIEDDIAFIAIMHFTERTSEELAPVMTELKNSGASGIILDLRSNPGGLLESVVAVASRFLDKGTVLSVVDNAGTKTVHSVITSIETTDMPMVVLTDNFTASASEVLAGALQDYARAVIAGTRTYGKGSVNLLYNLQDNSGLYITYARWLTPNGHMIEGEGITPDYELELEGEETVRWAEEYLRNNR